VRLRFVTSTPLDIGRGSGTYVGIRVLARGLEGLGHTVDFDTPRFHLPVYTVERVLFNYFLRPATDVDVVVGFDMDGYRTPDVAALKGVIADEVRFEAGATALTMGWQARCERLHVTRARKVLVTSRYSADRAQALYGLTEAPTIVPELIDLAEWRSVLGAQPTPPAKFTVLFVGRFYRRKRVDLLLRAAASLSRRFPEFELRIVGDGPCRAELRALARDLGLSRQLVWLGDVSRADLAREYNRCTMFCLPSVQEGFGIVLLEAMTAGKPIVAARAGAIPETAPHAVLVGPDSVDALVSGIESLYQSPDVRATQAANGSRWVEQFDAPRVAQLFLNAVTVT
jgi:glycosyltransferase involved in cell wall biosynthesis